MSNYNRDNFMEHTQAEFILSDYRNENPDYIDGLGARYWFDRNGVYRTSMNWGEVADRCNWILNRPDNGREDCTGFAFWSDFQDRRQSQKKELEQVALDLHYALRNIDDDQSLVVDKAKALIKLVMEYMEYDVQS